MTERRNAKLLDAFLDLMKRECNEILPFLSVTIAFSHFRVF